MSDEDLEVTREDYLEAERASEPRHELVHGEVFAMGGASRAHNLVVGNLVAGLHGRLRGRGCEVYANDMRVRVPALDGYTYPDVVVVCGEPELEDEHLDTLVNPTVIFEVMSSSTERYDRGTKAHAYRALPSLNALVLVAQDRPAVEVYTRRDDGSWLLADIEGLDATLDLEPIGQSLTLGDVYDRVPTARP